MSLEIKESIRLPKDGDLHGVDICQFKEKKKRCDKPATVYVTTTFGKKHYCGYHFSVILFKGKK